MNSILISVMLLCIVAVSCDAAAINATSEKTVTEYDKKISFLDIVSIIEAKKFGLDYLGELPTHAATSCQQIAKLRPNSTSGLYWIQVNSGPSRVYCNMDTTECGGGIWTRIANIDMTIPSTMCPRGLERVTSPKRSCRKEVDSGGTSSKFSTFGLPYNSVCGKIIGYQFGSPDAFQPFQRHHTVDNCYADGVLLSYNSPREHIWTFAAMADGYRKNSIYGCPCISPTTTYAGSVPRFVKHDYFCETGLPNGHFDYAYYTDDPLWDGKGCGTFPRTCEGTRSPWFHKKFSYTINSDVELRVCLDSPRSDEDILIEKIYMYIQ